MFLRPNEIALMRHDYETILRSPEACVVTIEYRTWLESSQPADPDPVYKVDRRLQNPDPVTVPNVRCLQKILSARDVKSLATQLMEVGDCIFYFSTNQNLKEPQLNQPVIDGSMVFIDPSGIRWVQKAPEKTELYHSLILRLGATQLGQPIPCKLEK